MGTLTAGAPAMQAQRVSDRSIRNLENLRSSGASSRTYNLVSIWQRFGSNEGYAQAPFFKSPLLNRSIILKHRLRSGEIDFFGDGRTVATKVILPINLGDLRAGARSFFIGQRGYSAILEDIDVTNFGQHGQDKALLDLLDSMPSLDPFLMRERLRKGGFRPDLCYFDISEADNVRMFEFTRREVAPLVNMTFQNMDAAINEKISKLAGKVLNNGGDAELDLLRNSLDMDKASFEEGVFCWKGFIYYKWSVSDLAPVVRQVAEEIASIRPSGPSAEADRAFIIGSRSRLTKAIAAAFDPVRATLKIYDDAYGELTQGGRPGAFRAFLFRAPSLFQELGERVGAVQHIVSFWRYRFPTGVNPRITCDELCDLLADFEHSLNFEGEDALRSLERPLHI